MDKRVQKWTKWTKWTKSLHTLYREDDASDLVSLALIEVVSEGGELIDAAGASDDGLFCGEEKSGLHLKHFVSFGIAV